MTTPNTATKNCDITPDISLMKKMASISGTVPSRVMELVDNAVDARIPGKPLRIDVNIRRKGTKTYLEVIDNGSGMNELVARSFFRLGDSRKEGKKKIGRFGLGAKVAILGLGDSCRVVTSPVKEAYAIDMRLDIDQFTKWKMNYKINEAKEEESGTYIRIDNLSVRVGNLRRFCERLDENFAKTYKHFIEQDEVHIFINNQEVTTTSVDLIPGLYHKFDFTISSGKRVYGYAGAMKKAGVNWKFGFDLISNGRIIVSNDFLSRQAHTSLARLTGEIHLDEFQTDVHKTDFLRDTHDFAEMQTILIEQELAEIITKITRLTNREVFTKYKGDMLSVSKVLNKVVHSYDFLEKLDIDDGVFHQLKRKAEEQKERKERKPKQEKQEQKEDSLHADSLIEAVTEGSEEVEESDARESKPRKKRNIGLLINEPIGMQAGEEQPARRWMVGEEEGNTTLTVEVNLDHPGYQTDDEKEVASLMKNAVMDSVAEFILQEEKQQNGFVDDEIDRLNRIKDMLIRSYEEASPFGQQARSIIMKK